MGVAWLPPANQSEELNEALAGSAVVDSVFGREAKASSPLRKAFREDFP